MTFTILAILEVANGGPRRVPAWQRESCVLG